MNRVTDSQPVRFIVRTYGRKPGQSDNVRQFNCNNLQSAVVTLARQMADPSNHKVEMLAVLEVFVAE